MRTTFLPLTRTLAAFFILCGVLLSPFLVSAQEGITLSLTPPFFQLTINPGETWSSSIKVVNVNDFPLTLYASVVNFEATGENGRGKFTPLLSEDPDYKKASLAGWIDVTDGPIVVAPGESVKVPFSINAPADASPGGHYAAILIGTEPVSNPEEGSYISVSSLISSLIFARVSGDVVESGDIREFSTEHTFYKKPDVSLSLRFENNGNVHLLPQGEITIYNMWGKERGNIPVNQRTDLGNVLPHSIRNFKYDWTGEDTPFEAGRYTAVATLSFGSDTRQNVSRTISFWVVPIVPVLSILGSFVVLVFIITWFIRRYIRRALGVEFEMARKSGPKTKQLAQPLVDGVMDLRNIDLRAKQPQKMSVGAYIRRYRLFFIFLAVVVVAIALASIYFGEVLVKERSFKAHEVQPVENYEVSNEAQ